MTANDAEAGPGVNVERPEAQFGVPAETFRLGGVKQPRTYDVNPGAGRRRLGGGGKAACTHLWPASREPRWAPYFTALVLDGRSREEEHRLIEGSTDLIVKIVDVDRDQARGWIQAVPPDDWGIGGVRAAVKRGAEIRARARAAGDSA